MGKFGIKLFFRCGGDLLDLLNSISDSVSVKRGVLIRKAVEVYLSECGKHGRFGKELKRLALRSQIESKKNELQFLFDTQRQMLKSGSFLLKDLPRDMPKVKKWIAGIENVHERKALGKLLYQREKTAKELARLINKYYRHSKKLELLDAKPYYNIK